MRRWMVVVALVDFLTAACSVGAWNRQNNGVGGVALCHD